MEDTNSNKPFVCGRCNKSFEKGMLILDLYIVYARRSKLIEIIQYLQNRRIRDMGTIVSQGRLARECPENDPVPLAQRPKFDATPSYRSAQHVKRNAFLVITRKVH